MRTYSKNRFKKVMADERKYTENEKKLGQYLNYANPYGNGNGEFSIDMNTVLDMLGITKKERATNDDLFKLPWDDEDEEIKVKEDRDPLNTGWEKKKALAEADLTEEEIKELTSVQKRYYEKDEPVYIKSPSKPTKYMEPIAVKNPANVNVIYMFRIPIVNLIKVHLKDDGFYHDEHGNIVGTYVYYELSDKDGLYYNTEDENDVKSIDQLLMLL